MSEKAFGIATCLSKRKKMKKIEYILSGFNLKQPTSCGWVFRSSISTSLYVKTFLLGTHILTKRESSASRRSVSASIWRSMRLSSYIFKMLFSFSLLPVTDKYETWFVGGPLLLQGKISVSIHYESMAQGYVVTEQRKSVHCERSK